jgi:protein-S-isoprenylcysteine O-methyltransferase Ste14
MSADDRPVSSTPQQTPVATARRILTNVFAVLVLALLWFWLAGRITWLPGWLLLITFILSVIALFIRLSRLDPQLLRERSRQAPNVESWDKKVMGLYTLSLVALLAISAIDSGRMRWSLVPTWAQVLGWVALLLAGALIWHVLGVNTYASSWARIQNDRAQQVITAGAYSRVRHPMYLGLVILFAALPLALASWWSFMPAAVIVALILYRTKREDLMLISGLPGYDDYAGRVRFRLIPGLW